MSVLSALHGTIATIVLCVLLFVDEAGAGAAPLPLAPGELLLLLGGVLFRTGALALWTFFPSALIAMTGGMLLGYSWARLAGRHALAALSQRTHAEKGFERVEAQLQSAGPAKIAVARLLPGIRPYATLCSGVGGVELRPFLAGALPALLAWEVFWVTIGTLIGLPAERALDAFEQLILRGFILLALSAAGYASLQRLSGSETPTGRWQRLRFSLVALVAGGAVACAAAGVLAIGRGLARSHQTTWVDALLIGLAVLVAAAASACRSIRRKE